MRCKNLNFVYLRTCKYNRIVLFPSLYMDLVIHVDLSKTPNSIQSD